MQARAQARLVVVAGAVSLGLSACDYATDQVKVKKATGMFRGWDHSSCECEFTTDWSDNPVVSLNCSPLFDGKDGYSDFIYFDATPEDVNARTLLWSYDEFYGNAVMEITGEVETFHDHDYRAVFIDMAEVPTQEGCVEYIGGYYTYYLYDVCSPYSGGTLEGVRAWCRLPDAGYGY